MKLISGVLVRLTSFFQLGIFLPHSSLVRRDCISIVSCVARPLLCTVRILCLLSFDSSAKCKVMASRIDIQTTGLQKRH